jgi:hypothetical protein
MRKPYSISLQVGGAREEAKTSWKKKRGNLSIVEKPGSVTLGEGLGATTDTEGRSLELKNSDQAFQTFAHRNFSVNQSTLHDSSQNLNTKLHKLEPITAGTAAQKRLSVDPTGVRIVSNLMNRDDALQATQTLKSKSR